VVYDVRTYDLKFGLAEEYGERIKANLPGREKLSPLGGYWYTEIGPLNQVINIWPYKDVDSYVDFRTRFDPVKAWGPMHEYGVNIAIVGGHNEVMFPAPFMKPLGERRIGPIYDMRIDTHAPGDIPKTLEAWGKVIDEREKLSPLAGFWHSDINGLNVHRSGRIIHLWAYKTFEDRARVLAESHKSGYWLPPGAALPTKSENQIMLPYDFSPMQ
jgi:hypothetical protein